MNIDRETFIAWMERIIERIEIADKKIERLSTQRNCLDGDETLQRYRSKGILPYLKLDDGRCYYKASDVHKMIREKL